MRQYRLIMGRAGNYDQGPSEAKLNELATQGFVLTHVIPFNSDRVIDARVMFVMECQDDSSPPSRPLW